MESRKTPPRIEEQQAKALLLFMVVLSYLITFTIASSNKIRFNVLELVSGLVLGVVYAILGVFEEEIFRPLGTHARNTLYFTIQICLVLGIGLTLGPGGNWFMGVPLASMAVMRLGPRWRWPVHGGVLSAGLLPIMRQHPGWQIIVTNALIIAAAILFAVVVAQYRLNDQAAREKAESLAVRLETANRKLAEMMRAKAGGENGRGSPSSREERLEESLSERELEVLILVSAGMSNREIAERLVISTGTAKTHIHHLCGKLGVRNRTEAAMKARELQLV